MQQLVMHAKLPSSDDGPQQQGGAGVRIHQGIFGNVLLIHATAQ